MPEPNAPAPPDDLDAPLESAADLQFEEAEYETPPAAVPSCDVCKRPIPDAYYEINGKVICASCRDQIEVAFRGGSRVARFLKALALGSLGALAGALLYYVIAFATGYPINLVAVVVGFMVGSAVRRGSGNRGGLLYQFLAVFLTYSAIGLMDFPIVIEAPVKEAPQPEGQATAIPGQAAKNAGTDRAEPKTSAIAGNAADHPEGAPAGPPRGAAAPAKDKAAVPEQALKTAENQRDAAGDPNAAGEDEEKSGDLWAMLVFSVIPLYAMPVIVASQFPMSGLIYCFALWEAWRINKGAKLAFSGPFRVSTGVGKAPAPEVLDDGN